jgi:CheY-like chemotaxis protein
MGVNCFPAALIQDPPRQASILIVEDDPGIGFLLLTMLKQETPYDVLLATDGDDALRLLATSKPDVAILDYQLPGMDGLELADHIRVMNGLEQIPLLLISANLPEAELEQRHLAGLSKPFEVETFLTVITRLLSS